MEAWRGLAFGQYDQIMTIESRLTAAFSYLCELKKTAAQISGGGWFSTVGQGLVATPLSGTSLE